MADDQDNDQTVSMQVPTELIAEVGPSVILDPGVEPQPDEPDTGDETLVEVNLSIPPPAPPPVADEDLPEVLIEAPSIDPLGSTMQTGAVTRDMVAASGPDIGALDAPPPDVGGPITRPDPANGPPTREDPPPEGSKHGVDTRKTVPTPVPADAQTSSSRSSLPLIVAIVIAIAGSVSVWQLYPVGGSGSETTALDALPGSVDVVGLVRLENIRTSWAGPAIQTRIDQITEVAAAGGERDIPLNDLLPRTREAAFGAKSTGAGQGLVVMNGTLDQPSFSAKLRNAIQERPGVQEVQIAGSTFYGGENLITGFDPDGNLLTGDRSLIEESLGSTSQTMDDHPVVSAAVATIDTSGDLWIAMELSPQITAGLHGLGIAGLQETLAPGDRLALSVTLADPTVVRVGGIFSDPIRAKKAKTSLDGVIALARATHAAASALGKPVEDATGGVLDGIEIEQDNESVRLNITLPQQIAQHLLERALAGNIALPPMGRPPARPELPQPPTRQPTAAPPEMPQPTGTPEPTAAPPAP